MIKAIGFKPVSLTVFLTGFGFAAAQAAPVFDDEFSAESSRWQPFFEEGRWEVADGVLRSIGSSTQTARLADTGPQKDALIEAKVKVSPEGRQCFGFIFRAQPDGTCVSVRYYDRPDALQLLTGTGNGHWHPDQPTSPPVHFKAGTWYRFKAAIVDDILRARLWPADGREPEWQFETEIGLLRPGGIGFLDHDASGLEVDSVRIWTEGSELDAMRRELAAAREAERRRVLETLDLKVAVAPLPAERDGRKTRRVDVVTTAGHERYSVAGTIELVCGRQRLRADVMPADAPHGIHTFTIEEPTEPTELVVTIDAKPGKRLESRFTLEPARLRPWRDYVVECVDTLIRHGTDRYGDVHTPMLMSILDVYTYHSPEKPEPYDAEIRTEERPTHGRLSPAGSNLWLDVTTLEVMYRLSKVTADPKYARAADDYIRATFEHASKPNGLLYWGSHSYYNAYTERHGGDGVHEILIKQAPWRRMHELDPDRFTRYAEALWQWHVVDKETGLHNRHDDGRAGCDFAFSGGSLAMAFSAMHAATEDPKWLQRARTVTSWHWDNRNRDTQLTADCPNLTRRYDGHHCFTTVSGPHAAALLRCYELTGDPYFRDVATAYVKAYDHYGWDARARTFHGMLKLDGTPVPEQEPGQGYDIWKPTGHVDIWRTTMYSYEMPLIAAQASAYACRLAADDRERKALLEAAVHWAEAITGALPPRPGRRWKEQLENAIPHVRETGGTYAENYGRAISFFVQLFHCTGDRRHLEQAEDLAREAVSKLYVNGIFRGHPAKPYYQTNEGVGFLLHALMELDALPERWDLAL